MKSWVLGICMVVMMCFGSPSGSQADPAMGDAQKAAEAWLSLIDAANYKEAWQQASGILRKVPQKAWTTMTRAVLDPLGPLADREFQSSAFSRMIPDAPAGAYAIVRFKTRYAYANGNETVTLVKGKDGTWKTADYSVGRTYGVPD